MPRNILIVDQGLEFGGSIVSAANLIRSMEPAKFNFVFVSANDEELIRSKLRERSDETEVITARKKIHYVNGSNIFRSLRRSRYRPVQRLGVAVFLLVKLLANAPYMFKIAACIRKYEIDLVQLNNGVDDEVGLVCKLLGVTHVSYLRGHTALSAPQRRFLLPAISSFFAVSTCVRQMAIGDGVAADKIMVAAPLAIREPVSPRMVADLRQRYGLADGQAAVGIFGRIVGWKGQKQFIEAAALVAERCDARFFIIGETTDGEENYSTELLQTVRKLGLEDRVIFTGYIEAVYDYYALMDLVVHASTLPEPFGRVILEAMSQGKPVIASNFGGPKEFVTEGEDGFLVDPWDRDTLARRILQIIQDPQLAGRLGRAAALKVQQSFSQQAYAKRMETLYHRALEADTRSLYLSPPSKRALQPGPDNES